jgi:hypothetical protein
MEMEYFRPSGKNSAVNLALLAIMTALATIMTIVIQIPYPGTSGYFNLGDTMVMLGGLLLGPVGGFFAGGVGSALADVITGWSFYAPITLVVKGFEGMAVGYLGSRVRGSAKINRLDVDRLFRCTGVLVRGSSSHWRTRDSQFGTGRDWRCCYAPDWSYYSLIPSDDQLWRTRIGGLVFVGIVF